MLYVTLLTNSLACLEGAHNHIKFLLSTQWKIGIYGDAVTGENSWDILSQTVESMQSWYYI